MTTLRRVGAYAKLLANYAADDAIIEAGEAAELLFVRGLAFLATSDSDGYITDAQVVRYVGAGMRDAMRRADRLAITGVWQRVDGGYHVRSWTKIHPTSEDKGRRLKADRERKRKPTAADSARNPNGIHLEGSPESLSMNSAVTVHDTTQQNRAPNPAAGSVASVIRAYVGACATHPAEELQSRIEKSAKSLLAQDVDLAVILLAAESAGRSGWTDLARQIQIDASRSTPGHGKSTTDDRVRSTLDLADQLDRRAIS